MCEDQEICVGLALWFKILQEGRRKKEEARAKSSKGFKGKNQTLDFSKLYLG